jgi:tetratricopeptide (TPR) repeat protein
MIPGLFKNRYVLGPAAVLLVLLGWFSYRALSERRLRAGLEDAARDMAAGNSIGARERLSSLAGRFPGRAEILFPLGESELACGRFDRAMDAWSQIPQSSPLAGQAALQHARILLQAGRFSESERILKDALEQPGPSAGELHHLMLMILVQQGRLGEARNLIEARWNEDGLSGPERLSLLHDHIALDFETMPLDGNLEFLGITSATESDDDGLWLARANLALKTGRLEESSRWLDAATVRRGDDQAVWRARLEWARASGRLDQAGEAMAHLKAADFGDDEIAGLGAWIAERKGDVKAEKHALEQALEANPGDLAALERLAELNFREGNADLGRRLRGRKSELDASKDRYHRLFIEGQLESNAPEMARLAADLGRDFEARAFMTLGARAKPGNHAAPDEVNRLGPSRPARSGRSESLASRFSRELARTTRPQGEGGSASAFHFEDDAGSSGLAGFVLENGLSPSHQLPEVTFGGAGLIDFDGDGFLDVYLIQGGRFPPEEARPPNRDRLFHNRGDGTFDDVSRPSGLSTLTGGYGHGISVGDYDNDGNPDIFLTRWRSYALYRNRGDGTFEDATERAGLTGNRDWPTSSAFADFDNDGDLDLYVCHYGVWDAQNPPICKDPSGRINISCDPRSIAPLADHVFRNDNGRFVDVTEQAGIIDRDGRGLGVAAADFDGDGLTDVFVANDSTANFLFHNLGGFRFEEVGHAAGVAANSGGGYQAGMGVACGDSNGDGTIDLAVTNFYGESTSLFHNLGRGLFVDHTSAVGLAAPSRYVLGFGAAFLDANNDGRLDLMTANGHVNDLRPQFPFQMTAQLYRGEADGRLTDVTATAGLPFLQLHVGRGLASGDLDNDGRVDALLIAQNEPPVYLHNRTESKGAHFAVFRLQGTKSNRDGVGASVTITAGACKLVAQRFGGGSYQTAGDPRLHFGLGAATRIDRVEVRWPRGQVDQFEDVAVDTQYVVVEGARTLDRIVVKHP